MFARLRIPTPDAWYSSLPERRWNPRTRTMWYRPVLPQRRADEYEHHLYALMVSAALRRLNAEHDPLGEYEMVEVVVGDLRRVVRIGAERAGLRFIPGRTQPRHVLDGVLSERWLLRATRRASEAAIELWYPHTAQRRHDAAVQGGRSSRRLPRLTPADLPPGSIKAQAEALNVSRSTIARLRREARRDAA